MQIRACLLFLFLSILTTAYSQTTWQTYESIDHDFKVLLPELPKVKSKNLITEIGSLLTKNYSVSLDKKSTNFFYSINTVNYPPLTFSKDSTAYNNEVINSHIDALSTNLKCKLVYKNEIQISGEAAYLFRLSDEVSGEVVKGQIVLYKDKIYTVTVFTLLDRSLNSDIDKFLSSFELIKML